VEIDRKSIARCRGCHNKKQDKGLSRERAKFNASKGWAKVRTECFERDDYTCQICGLRDQEIMQVDHIKPKSLFKYTSYSDKEFLECWSLKNLQPLEAKQNMSKGKKYIDDKAINIKDINLKK
jgi:5-methylcytosine-specific restriction endonuclease McrA